MNSWSCRYTRFNQFQIYTRKIFITKNRKKSSGATYVAAVRGGSPPSCGVKSLAPLKQDHPNSPSIASDALSDKANLILNSMRASVIANAHTFGLRRLTS